MICSFFFEMEDYVMGKVSYNILILFFFTSALIFYGHGQSIKEYDKITNEYFNSTIYLKTEIDQENSIKTLKTIADDYDLTVAKIIPNHDGTTDIFVYSHDNKYTDKFLYSNKFVNNKGHSGEITLTLYNKGIFIRALDNLESIGVQGKYTIHAIEPSDMENIIKKINSDYSKILTIYANQKLKNTFTTNVDEIKYFYGIILIAILFSTLLICYLYDVRSIKKEIAVKSLFGYGVSDIFYDNFIDKALKPIAVSVLISELIATIFFIFNKNISNIETLKYFLIGSLKFSIILVLVLIVTFSITLLVNIMRKSQKLNIVSYIKGMNVSGNILSILVKMGSTLLIIIFFGLTVISWNFVAEKREAINSWEKTKNYYSLNIYVPQFIIQNKKNSAEFEKTHRAIWSFLNDKNGIMFYKVTNKINPNPVLIHGVEKDIPFVYINENYLHKNLVFDTSDNRIISVNESDINSLTLLVPLQYKSYEKELRQIIHEKHVFDKYISEDIINERITGKPNSVDLSEKELSNPDITEKLVYIKDNQKLFTYAAGGDFVINGIYALVSGKNMGLNVYTPSLNKIHVNTVDIDRLNKETKLFLNDLGYGVVDTDFASVYHQNAEDIRYFKNIMMFSISVFVLNFVFLIFSLLYYLEVYFINNKKRIAIKNFLGYSFLSRNKKAFISLFVQDMVIVAISIIFGFLAEKTVIGLKILVPILIICLLTLLFDILCSIIFLKMRESMFLAETLKGE